MTKSKATKILQAVGKLMSPKIPPGFSEGQTVTSIFGPSRIIEVMVANAVASSGVEMDWCYQGGRAFIQVKKGTSQEDYRKARLELCFAKLEYMPDFNIGDVMTKKD